MNPSPTNRMGWYRFTGSAEAARSLTPTSPSSSSSSSSASTRASGDSLVHLIDVSSQSSNGNAIFLIRGVPFHATLHDIQRMLRGVVAYHSLTLCYLKSDEESDGPQLSGNVFLELAGDEGREALMRLHLRAFACREDDCTAPMHRPRPRFLEVRESSAEERQRTIDHDATQTLEEAMGHHKDSSSDDTEGSTSSDTALRCLGASSGSSTEAASTYALLPPHTPTSAALSAESRPLSPYGFDGSGQQQQQQENEEMNNGDGDAWEEQEWRQSSAPQVPCTQRCHYESRADPAQPHPNLFYHPPYPPQS